MPVITKANKVGSKRLVQVLYYGLDSLLIACLGQGIFQELADVTAAYKGFA
jgi:hypothetical protein